MNTQPAKALYVLFPALTMSLGWGLRGFIGGGTFGAMIPGALVALALCLLLERSEAECGLIAAWGAVGVGFGGQETYGQTVGFILRPDTFWWGFAGLSLKGVVWGLLGGAILGAALAKERPSLRDAAIGLALIPLGTWVGWKLVNEPKLIYFSDPINKPREEVWAGLLLGSLVWLGWLTLRGVGRIPWRFALWGAAGGIGFGVGGAVMSLGHNVPIGPRWYDWWKVMELVFGFCFGAALGLCAWVYRNQLGGSGRKEPERAALANPWLQFILVVALAFCVFGLGYLLHLRITYAVLGPVLLWIALRWPGFAWHIAVTLTFFAFARDVVRFSEVQHFGSPAVLWTFAVLLSAAACALILERLGGARPMAGWTFLFLLWTAVLVSWAKALLHPGPMRAGAINETLFTIFAMILTRAVSKSFPVRAASTVSLAALLLFPAAVRAAESFSGMELEWSVDFKEAGVSNPVHFWKVDGARGVLVTLASGKVVLVDPKGKVVASAPLDLPSESLAVAGELLPGGGPAIVAADVWGSLYAFNEKGQRLWKFPRREKARDLRLPVLADLDGDGKLDVVMTDSRGHLYCLDGSGRPKFEVTATRYRAGTPSVGDLDGDGKPEIVFGTDDGDVYAIDRRGGVLWSAKLDGRFGRSLPLVADVDHDGRYEVYMPTSFNARGAGLFALDAATGNLLWKANSVMQSYRSTVVADLDGDGRDEILFADKNTRLYRVDAKGVQQWSTQMDGRGMFFAPAVADLEGEGRARIFAVVRGAGTNGQSLYVLDPEGKIVHSMPLPGGGAGSPILCRFEGRKDVSLVVLSGAGQLLCYRLPQKPAAARILWSGLRNDALNSGFVASRAKVARRIVAPPAVRLPVSLPRAEELPSKPVAEVRQIDNPWGNFHAADLARTAPAGSISVGMLGNEYESAAIAVTNLEDRPVTFRLECGPFVSGAKTVVDAKKVLEFREVLEVLPNTTGQPSEDALPRLGEAQTIRLGAGETRKIWLTLRSHGLPAGRHTATLRIGDPLSLRAPLEVPVTLTVHPVRLPERFTYRHCNWLAFSRLRDEAVWDAVIQDALDHGTNVFVIPSVTFSVDANGEPGAPDGGLHDVLVRRLRGKAMFLVSGSVGLRWPAGAKSDAQAHQRTWAEAVRRYAAHMEELGCDYSDWAFYLQDEPGLNGPDAYYDAYVDLVKNVKAADPRARIYANPAGGARPSVLKRIENLIDIWSPDLHLVREQPEELGKIFRRRKEYWHYEAPADQRNLDPLGFYRVKPWVAFQLGMNGGGYWTYHFSDLWFHDPSVASEYGVVYLTDKGPVPTKRWEASRDGIEDFELLGMLRETAKRSNSPAAKEALALIEEAVAFVTRGQEQVSDISRQLHPYTPDYRKWMEYRDRLIQMQVRLSQE